MVGLSFWNVSNVDRRVILLSTAYGMGVFIISIASAFRLVDERTKLQGVNESHTSA